MRGQANYIDFVVALGLFIIILFIFISFNQSQKDELRIADEALMISDSLLSDGIPPNWTETDNYRPGLLENGSFSAQRWESLHALMGSSPEDTKYKYTLLSDFMVRIGNYTQGAFTPVEINGISYITTNDSISPSDFDMHDFRRIDRVERAFPYNGTILILEVIAWR